MALLFDLSLLLSFLFIFEKLRHFIVSSCHLIPGKTIHDLQANATVHIYYVSVKVACGLCSPYSEVRAVGMKKSNSSIKTQRSFFFDCDTRTTMSAQMIFAVWMFAEILTCRNQLASYIQMQSSGTEFDGDGNIINIPAQ